MGTGTYPLRLSADERKLLEDTSSREGVPMSQLIREGIVTRCTAGGTPSSVTVQTALAKLAEAAALLSAGQVPAPLNGAARRGVQVSPATSWDALMDGGGSR